MDLNYLEDGFDLLILITSNWSNWSNCIYVIIIVQVILGREVENKFDHRTFALKQIKIHPREDLDKVLKEVENLSKVKTKNVTMIFLSIAFL